MREHQKCSIEAQVKARSNGTSNCETLDLVQTKLNLVRMY
jgi:hypothetical protein